MVQLSFKASAPGSLMVMGEHAVLRHHHAIVAAVDQRIEVRLMPRVDKLFHIYSALGECQGSIENVQVTSPFEYVLSVILYHINSLQTGFDLHIHSQFRHDLGLGSSAAVLVATLAVFQQWVYQQKPKSEALYDLAKSLVLKLKGKGSGADIAASIYGGVLHLTTLPFNVEKLPVLPDLTVVYCGYKTATATVIDLVAKQNKTQPKKVETILKDIHQCVLRAVEMIKHKKWVELGICFSQQQALMKALKVSDDVIDLIIEQLEQQPAILGSKISGSGLGDCVIGLGQTIFHVPTDVSQTKGQMMMLLVKISEQGLRYD